MEFRHSVLAMVAVVVLTLAAAGYRVSTAPDRIRQRLDAARQTCASSGGRWVRNGRDEACLPTAAATKS